MSRGRGKTEGERVSAQWVPTSEGAKAGAGWGLYCEVQCFMGYGELKTLPSRNFAAYLLCRSLCDALTRASV